MYQDRQRSTMDRRFQEFRNSEVSDVARHDPVVM